MTTTTPERVGLEIHELKSWPSSFFAVRDETKTAEFRRNDRDFQAGDLILLREFIPSKEMWLTAGLSETAWTDCWWIEYDFPKDIKEGTDAYYEAGVEKPVEAHYTGESLLVRIEHVQTGFGIPDGFVMLSIRKIKLT